MAVTRDGTRGVLEADAREWGLTLRQSLSLATVAPIIALVGLALVPFRDVFTALADEDGPVEYAQWALIVGLVVLYALIGRLPMTGEEITLKLDEVDSFQVVG